MSMAIKLGFCARKNVAAIGLALVIWFPAVVFGQTNYYATNGTEYAIVGSLPGDQVHSDVAVTTTNGLVVWQDNITDGDGWGVSAMRLNGTLSGSGSSFRVNVQGAGDQENPRVAMLKGGGAVIVWQGGVPGLNHHDPKLSPRPSHSSTHSIRSDGCSIWVAFKMMSACGLPSKFASPLTPRTPE